MGSGLEAAGRYRWIRVHMTKRRNAMSTSPHLNWQPSLFGASETTSIDESFGTLTRLQLDPDSWIDHAPGWVSGSDALFEQLLETMDWGQRSRPMYEKRVIEEARKFLVRPKEGGASRAFLLGRGDLLVTGGKMQRTWDHSVPKVASAGPRISIAYRYGLDRTIYDNAQATEPT